MLDMASRPLFLHHAITYVLLIFLVSFSPISFSQIAGKSPPVPTVASCGPSFLVLASCAPFVQGSMNLPVQQCCDNLQQLYQQRPSCICLLLNGSTLSSFPINSTRALQLPGLCSLDINIATCGVTQGVAPFPPSSPASQVPSQVPNGTKSDTRVAATPMASVLPRPTIMGFGYHPSTGLKLKTDHYLIVVLTVAAIVLEFTKLL